MIGKNGGASERWNWPSWAGSNMPLLSPWLPPKVLSVNSLPGQNVADKKPCAHVRALVPMQRLPTRSFG
jgi:hypothetical protein